MTKLELAQRIQQEVNSFAVSSPIQTTVLDALARPQHLQIVRGLESEYWLLQMERQWTFRQQAGELFEADAGIGDYVLPTTAEEFVPFAFKIKKKNTTYSVPLVWMDWQDWLEVFDIPYPQLGNSWPTHITQLPNMSLRLTPKPNEEYSVEGVWFIPADQMDGSVDPELDADDDQPIWHRDLHEVLVWRTAQRLLGEVGASEALAMRIGEQVQVWNQKMRNRYLP